MSESTKDINDLLNTIRPIIRSQNRGFEFRFRTSDIMQECAVQLIKEKSKRQNTSNDLPSNRGWLKTIAVSVVCKMRRFHLAKKRDVRRESQPSENCIEESHTPSEIAVFREMSAQLFLAIANLEKSQRRIVHDHYHRGLSLAKIAEQLELDPQYVRRQHKSALEKLRMSVAGDCH